MQKPHHGKSLDKFATGKQVALKEEWKELI